MQQQLIGKFEKVMAPIVEELDTNVTTLQINEENNERIEATPDLSNTWQRNLVSSDSSTTHGATDQEWSTPRKKYSSKKGSQSEIVRETQDQGQIAQGTSQRQVFSTNLAGNMATIYFVREEIQNIDDLIPKEQ
ncbi:hypothetical protein AMTRI_Chr04g183290 [Amborella trichopoda]